MVTLEAVFNLIDRASGPLRSIQRNAMMTDRALGSMGGGKQLSLLSESFGKAEKSSRSWRREIDAVGGSIRGFKTRIEESTRSLLQHHPAIIKVTKGLSGLGGAAVGAWKAFGVLPGLVASFLPQIVSLAGAVGGLATSLIGAVGGGAAIGGGLLGSFAAGLGSVVAVAKPAVTQLTNYRTAVQNLAKAQESGNATAIKTAQAQMDAIGKVNPGVAELSKNISGMESAWKRATAPGRADFFKLANASISSLRQNLGWLSRDANKNMASVRTAVEGQLKPIMAAFRSLETGLSRVFRANVGGFAGGFTNILRGLSNILKVIEPQLTHVGDGFRHLTERFAEWTASTRGQGQIREMTKAFHEWMRLLGQIVELIGHVTGAGMRTGTSEISKWADKLTKVNEQLGTGKGQRNLENWFKRTMQNTNQLWGPLKNLANTLLTLSKAWEPIGKTVQWILSKFPAPVLTGFLALYAGIRGIGTARTVAGKVGGPLERFAGKGSTPANPLFVADVTGGGGGAGLIGGGGLRERFRGTRLGGRIASTRLGGRLLGGAAAGVGEQLALDVGETAAAKTPGLFSRLLGTFTSRTGIGRGAAGVAAGEESMGVLGRLFKGQGVHGVGGLTGGFGGMALMAAMPAVTRLIPKGLRESALGRGVGGVLGGFLSGGTAGAGIMAANALLPSSITRSRAGKAATNIGMMAATGATIGTALGGPGIGTAVGAGVGATAAGLKELNWNPFSESGRKKIASDAGKAWDGIKKGVSETGKWIGQQAVKFNPFSARGQRNIAHAATQAWNTVKGGVTDAGKWVARQAVKFNPFSESGRRNIARGASDAWKAIKSAFSAAGKWFAGVGRAIARPFIDAWNWVKNAARNVFNWLKGAVSDVVKAVVGFFTKTPLGRIITKPFRDAWDWIKGLPGRIAGVAEDIAGAFKKVANKVANAVAWPFKWAFNWLKDHLPKIEFKTHKVLGLSVPLPSIHLAQGGVVPRSTDVLVGERGPEIAHLPAGTRVTPTHKLPEFAMQTGAPRSINLPAGLGRVSAPGVAPAAGAAGGADFQKVLATTSATMTKLVKQSQQINSMFRGIVAALNRVENEFINPRSGFVGALSRTTDQLQDFGKTVTRVMNGVDREFDQTGKNTRQNLTQIVTDSRWMRDQLQKLMTEDVKKATDALQKNFSDARKGEQTSWNNIVTDTRWGVDTIFRVMSNAFKSMGVPAPKGVTAATKKGAKGVRLPGKPRGDHIPLYDRGGNVMGIADGGELVVNRHTEKRVDSMLADKGTTLGREVAGETTPHAARGREYGGRVERFRAGGRIPRFQTGGVVGQVNQFFSQRGWNKVAIAGILGNAWQESGGNPNTPGGGMWQQISNFGQGTGGTLQAQMEKMNTQIGGLRGPMNAAGSPGAAAQIFEQGFERAGIPAMANRIKYANLAYAGKLGGAITGGAAAPLVTIVAPRLRARGELGALGQGALGKITAGANNALQQAAVVAGGAGGVGPAPMTGPKAVQAMVRAANEIASHHYNYEWGGGHGAIGVPGHGTGHGSGPGVGFDCSGSVSAVLHAAGLLNTPLTSGSLATWGAPGPGKNITIYANPVHTYMSLNGHFFGTSGANPGGGAGWFAGSARPGFAVRHPPGLALGGRMPRQTRRGTPRHRARIGLREDQFTALPRMDQQRLLEDPTSILPGKALGGRLVPWFAQGADFVAKRPTVIGVGDAPGGERVTVTPQGQGPNRIGNRPLHVEIHRIEVNRKGDVQKIVDEELRLLATTIEGRL